MLNLKIAVPLYCYTELNAYEAVYESAINRLVGLHLYESATKNWKNLPSPNYDKLWTAGYKNKREALKNDRIRQAFDAALSRGIIRLDEGRGMPSYTCRYGDLVDIRKRFGYIEKGITEGNLSAPQARAAMAELDSFLNDQARGKYQMTLFDADEAYAKGLFITMPTLSDRVAAELALQEGAAALRTHLERIDRDELKYSHFAQALYMGVIFKRRKLYKYNLDNQEYTLHTMENISDQYVDYEVFQAYLALDEGIISHLQKKAQDEENRYTDEQYVKLLKTIGTYIKTYGAKLEQLSQNFYHERDWASKKMFYREMRDIFIKEKAALS